LYSPPVLRSLRTLRSPADLPHLSVVGRFTVGPKIQEGDRQAPEGFYTITPDLMNPNSHYHLAINTGFPNAYEQLVRR
jgi:murein L,D-transpeptidase YafK